MKKTGRLMAFVLSFALAFSSMGSAAFAARDDDDEDYAVSDVGFDISDESIYIYWETGESKCNYKVELFKSSNMISKNRVGEIMTASYSAAKVDVTQRILNKGSGTYYARVTCKKRAKDADEYEYAIGSETISSDELSVIRTNYKKARTDSQSGSANPTGGPTGVSGGPGASSQNPTAPGSPAGGAPQWQQLGNGQWAAVAGNGVRLTGWYQMNGKWYYSGEDGVMWASRWIPSASEPGVWFYVDPSGAMLVNATTPDGYQVDGEGKWRQ